MLHWGHGIAVFYSFFICTLVIVVVKSTGFDNSLVTEDYYDRDIHYQREYERRVNSRSLADPVRLEAVGEGFALAIPTSLAADAAGTLHLYRPSSQAHDRRLRLRLDREGRMALPLEGLPRGRYLAIVEWESKGTAYYDEIPFDRK